MSLDQIIEAVVAFFVVLGGVFGLVGSYGLLKLRDTMQRLHAPTKATTLGVGGVLIASMLHFAALRGHVSFHELLIALFLFLTAPITANFIAKTYLVQRPSDDDLPGTGGSHGWAIHDSPPTQSPEVPIAQADPAPARAP